MLSINEKISLRQLQALIVISAMGTGVIVLPRRVAEYAQSDGWLIALGLTLLAMVIGALVSTAARLRPASSFVQSSGFFLTKPIGYILGAVLWLKLVMAAGLELRVFTLVLREVLLKHTPMAVTGIALLAVAAYAAVKGIETRAMVAEVLLALMVLPFLILIIIALIDMDWSNLQPTFVTPPKTLLQGTLRLGFVFIGLECVLLVSPYIHPGKKMRKAVITALGVAGLIITVITVLTLAAFGRGVVDLQWPVLRMMDMLSLPGAFIERQEALMFSFWIITNFALISGLLFFGGVLFKDFLRVKTPSEHRPHGPTRANKPWQIGVLITTAAVFIVTCIPWDAAEIYERMDFMSLTLGAFYLIVLPLIMILASKLKKARSDCPPGKITCQDHIKTTPGKTPSGASSKPSTSKAQRILALLALATISLCALSSCWDKIEIENRAFVVAISVDKGEDTNYTVTLSLPAPTDGSDDKDEGPAHIKNASAQTITEAIKKIDTETDTPLYFGQAKMLVIGANLMEEPDLVRGVLDFFNRHKEVDRAMHVLAAHGMGADILTSTPPGGALPGQYVDAIYQDKYKIGGTSFVMSLEKLITYMKYNDAMLMPSLKEDEGKLSLDGAVLVSNNRKVGQLSGDDLGGYLWCFDNGGIGAIVTPMSEGQPIPFKIEKHTAEVRFKEQNSKLQANIRVELAGHVEECDDMLLKRQGYRQHIISLVEETVKEEILRTADKMQNEFKLDGYHWLEIMRKKQYNLYKSYAPHWGETFPKITITPNVTVTIRE